MSFINDIEYTSEQNFEDIWYTAELWFLDSINKLEGASRTREFLPSDSENNWAFILSFLVHWDEHSWLQAVNMFNSLVSKWIIKVKKPIYLIPWNTHSFSLDKNKRFAEQDLNLLFWNRLNEPWLENNSPEEKIASKIMQDLSIISEKYWKENLVLFDMHSATSRIWKEWNSSFSFVNLEVFNSLIDYFPNLDFSKNVITWFPAPNYEEWESWALEEWAVYKWIKAATMEYLSRDNELAYLVAIENLIYNLHSWDCIDYDEKYIKDLLEYHKNKYESSCAINIGNLISSTWEKTHNIIDVSDWVIEINLREGKVVSDIEYLVWDWDVYTLLEVSQWDKLIKITYESWETQFITANMDWTLIMPKEISGILYKIQHWATNIKIWFIWRKVYY